MDISEQDNNPGVMVIPRQSKWWSEMITAKNIDDKVTISTDKPSIHQFPKGIVIHISNHLSNEEKEEMIKFISNNEVNATGNYTLLTNDLIELYTKMKARFGYLAKMVKGKKETIGTIINIPIKLSICGENIISTYTFFLAVDKNYRDKGLGIGLIRSMIKEIYDNGLMHGYHLVDRPHHTAAHRIRSWYRPINLTNSKRAGFEFPSYKKIGDRNEFRNRLAYGISAVSTSHQLTEDDNSYDLLMKLQEGYKIRFNPALLEWLSFIKIFKIYATKDAIFALSPYDLIVGENRIEVRLMQLIFAIGNPESIFQNALYHSKDYDLLYGYVIGSIGENDVTTYKGVITKAETYLELYNSSIIPFPIACSLPLF